MTLLRLLRATGIVVLTATALPFGPESGSAAEPALAPATVALDPAEPRAESHVLVQRPGRPAQDPARGFVVLARRDGRVPRAWLWDEPLGCPPAR